VKSISRTFLPALFDDEYDNDDPRRQLTFLPVKHAGMALPEATSSSFLNYDSSTLINGHLFRALIGAIQFQSKDHVSTIQEAKVEIQERKLLENDTKLEFLASKNCHAIARRPDSGV
jgi:hypothetical protein